MIFREFYTCPNCGTTICGEKKEYFVCPDCGRALCLKEEVKDFDHNYCSNCGCELASAKDEAKALVEKN